MVRTQGGDSFHPTSQLLMRNRHMLYGRAVLVVNYPSDPFLWFLQEQWTVNPLAAFTYHYAAHQYGCALFQPEHDTPPELHYGALCPLVQQLVGQNNAGIRSTVALLEEVIGPTHKVDAARHCLLLQATLRATAPPFDLEEWGANYQIEVKHAPLTVVCFPGVFSYGRLDEGTALLLTTLTTPIQGRVLDFGCGAGVIGAAVKALWPAAQIEMVDIDALALLATRCTLTANGLAADAIYPSNVFSAVTALYDWIVSNPPFHEGVQQDYKVVTTFFKQATTYLAPGGRLRLVANRFLKYQPLIEAHIGQCHVLAESSKYRVYEATCEKEEGDS